MEKYLEKLKTFDKVISEKYNEEKHRVGILGGLSGLAIFQFHYAKLVNNDISAKTGASILENCIEGINNGQYNHPTYCNGICGFGWAINYLYKNDFVNLEIEESLLQIDTFLYKRMLSNIEKEHYDFSEKDFL